MNEPRTVQLRRWMSNCNMTYRWIGEQLGITGQGACSLLKKETVPVKRYVQLKELGIPVHLLPTPMDIPTGPHRKAPTFSGLAAAQ